MPALVRAPDGTIGSVAEKDLQQALDAGASTVTAEEVRAEDIEKKYGGVGGAGLAAAAGAARGLSFGLSDLAGKGLGYAADLEGLQEANPTASIGGEIAGFVAPLLVSGGSAGAAKGGLALATAPGRAVLRGGEAIELAARGLVGASAESLAGKMVQKGVPMALRGALEGAAYGAGSVITEESLGDRELAAEKIMAGALNGAIFGGAAAGSMGVLAATAGHGIELAGAKASKAMNWLRGGAANESVANLYTKSASVFSGGDIEAIEKMGIQNHSAEAKRIRQLATFEAPKVRADASRSIRENLDSMLEANARIAEEAKGSLKAEYVAKAVKTGNELETFTASTDLLRGMREELGGLALEAKYAKNSGAIASLKRTADDAFQILEDAERKLADASNAERFTVLDQVKRDFGKYTKELQSVERSDDPFKVRVGREMRDSFERFYENARQHLQSEELWGKAGADQSRINAAWTKQIEAQGIFDQRLTTEFGRDEANPFRRKFVVDAAKADAYVGGLTNPNNDLTHRAVRGYVEGTRDFANAVAEAFDLPAGKVAEVRRVAENAAAFGQTIDKTEKTLALANQLQALRATEQGGVTALGGAAGGAMLGGPLGAVAGAALGAVARPGQAIVQLAALERIVQRVDSKITAGVRGFLDETPRRALQAAGRASRAMVPLGVYRRQAEEFLSNPPPPAAVQARVEAATGTLGNAAPGVTAHIAAKAAAAYGALANRAPQKDSVSPLAPARNLRGSDTVVNSFGKYLRTLSEPLSIFDDLKSGRVSRESVDALRENYPSLYRDVQAKLVDELARKGKTLSYQKRVQLGVLFDVPADASMTPEMFATLQNTFVQGASQQADEGVPSPIPRRKIDVASAVTTEAQKSEAPQ